MLNVLVSYIKFDFRVHFKLIVCTVEQGAKGKILMLDGGRMGLTVYCLTGNIDIILVQFYVEYYFGVPYWVVQLVCVHNLVGFILAVCIESLQSTKFNISSYTLLRRVHNIRNASRHVE